MGTEASRPLSAALLLWACVAAGPHGARAQTGQAPPPAPPELREQAPRATSPDEPAAVSEGAGSLSDRLERSEGVIAPADPGTDPGIVRPTPDAGASAMPIIPPLGGPGGDPNVRPR